MNDDIAKALKSADNEATRAPWWCIVDPRQNMNLDIYAAAAQITGPFFSRQDAQEYLDATRYNFGKRAKVFCMSGYYSHKYEQFCKSIGV